MPAEIAVLVLAHDPVPTAALLALLDARFDVFVHMDAKTALDASFVLPTHARLITQRHAVFWGGWSMMQATLALVAAAREVGGFRRFVLVSGDCLPVVALDRMVDILLDESREFVELQFVPDDPSLAGMDMQAAIERHGWVQPWRRYNPVCWDHVLLNPFQRENVVAFYGLAQSQADWLRGDVSDLVGNVLHALARPCPYPDFYYGSQWWALTAPAVDLVVREIMRQDLTGFFRFIQVPDEHVVPSVLGNHGVAGSLGPMMYTDLARRVDRSHVLVSGDLAKARDQDCLFARKFDPGAAPEIAEAIRRGVYWDFLERDRLGLNSQKA